MGWRRVCLCLLLPCVRSAIVGAQCDEVCTTAVNGARRCGWLECPKPGSRGPRVKFSELVHYHIAKNAGTTLRSVLKVRYQGIELHGPKKQPYARYFHSRERRWRGRYFVAFAREPISKLLSQFFYVRASLGGAFGKWHRCVTFREYVESRRARHNHQFSQLIAGHHLKECAAFNESRRDLEIVRPRHETGQVDEAQTFCDGGEAALRRRVRQILSQPRLFVGLVEDFDASLLALQRETGMPDVTYCQRRATKGALHELDPRTEREARRRNRLDEIVYNVSLDLHRLKRCCYGVSDADVADFRRHNAAMQKEHCRASSMEHRISNKTVGNPAWRQPDCSSNLRGSYSLPQREQPA